MVRWWDSWIVRIVGKSDSRNGLTVGKGGWLESRKGKVGMVEKLKWVESQND